MSELIRFGMVSGGNEHGYRLRRQIHSIVDQADLAIDADKISVARAEAGRAAYRCEIARDGSRAALQHKPLRMLIKLTCTLFETAVGKVRDLSPQADQPAVPVKQRGV